AGNVLWTSQVGSPDLDVAFGIAAGASGIYVAGVATAALPGQTALGWRDVVLLKYNTTGNLQWIRQFGTSDGDYGTCVAVDDTGVYIGGNTFSPLPGQASAGDMDTFVRKYDVAGNVLWTRQYGTRGREESHGVTVDATGIYVTGNTTGTLP